MATALAGASAAQHPSCARQSPKGRALNGARKAKRSADPASAYGRTLLMLPTVQTFDTPVIEARSRSLPY